MSKFVLVIGGSDSSGGSGIQADLRALQYIGVPAASAVTAVTAQGRDGVVAVQLVTPEILEAQIAQAFASYDIGSVKIGMLGSSPQVDAVVKALRARRGLTVVLDPVLASSSGTSLLDEEGRTKLLRDLLPLATVVLPNIPELQTLTGMPVETDEDRIAAGRHLMALGAKSVIVKGGHLDEPVELVITPDGYVDEWRCSSYRLRDSRGTGCVFAAYLASYLSHDARLSSIRKAVECNMQRALENAYFYSETAPGLLLTGLDARNVRGIAPPSIQGIYCVTDPGLNPAITTAMGARFAAEGGARIVQLRDKAKSTEDLIKTGKIIQESMRRRGSLFIVNDRVDIAMALDADGVHLGPDDMHPQFARNALGWRKIIGASVSTVEEAKAIATWVDYLAVGAIFGSATKGDAGNPVGVERITEIKKAFPDKKIVAIGGINVSNIASVAAAGADAAAVISAIVCTNDPEQATRDLLAEFERGRKSRL